MIFRINKVPIIKIKIMRSPKGGESPVMLSLFRPQREERRKKPRQKSRNLVAADMPQRVILNMVNLSESGMQFSSPLAFKKDQKVDLTINLVEEHTQFKIKGCIVWNKLYSKGKDHPLYRVGISFLDLGKEAGTVIRHFIYSPLRA